MSCIAPEHFVELLETGRFDRPEPEVARHLAECPACRDAWAAIGAADEVLPSLRPVRRGGSLRAMSSAAAAVLLLLLGSMLWMGDLGRRPAPGSALTLRDAEKELRGLIDQLRSDDVVVRERAEKGLVELARRVGKDSLRWLRDQERKAGVPEVKSRITAVLQRLTEPQVLWTAILEGASFGAIAPAVDPRVCVFSSSGSIFGVDPQTGKVLWTTGGDYRAHAAVAPAAAFVPLPRGPKVAIRALHPTTGEQLWAHGLADLWNPPPENDQSYYHDSSILLAGPVLYTGTRTGSLVCLDAKTGKRQWATPPRERECGFFSPVLRDGTVFVAEWRRGLLAFDAETGKFLWEAKVSGMGVTPPVVVGDRVIVATHEYGKETPPQEWGGCTALSATNGQVLWTSDFSSFGKGAMGLIHSGGMLVAQAKTHLVGLSPETGAVRWSVACKRFGYSTMDRDDRGRVYAASDDGKLLVLQAASGKVLLTFDPNKLRDAEGAPKVNSGIPDLGTAGCPTVLGRDVFMMSQSGFAVAVRMSEFLGETD